MHYSCHQVYHKLQSQPSTTRINVIRSRCCISISTIESAADSMLVLLRRTITTTTNSSTTTSLRTTTTTTTVTIAAAAASPALAYYNTTSDKITQQCSLELLRTLLPGCRFPEQRRTGEESRETNRRTPHTAVEGSERRVPREISRTHAMQP